MIGGSTEYQNWRGENGGAALSKPQRTLPNTLVKSPTASMLPHGDTLYGFRDGSHGNGFTVGREGKVILNELI